MSFFATGRDYRRENVKTRPTKGIPKRRKSFKSRKCSQCGVKAEKCIILGSKDKRYLCMYHYLCWEKRDYDVSNTYNHFKKGSEV